MKRSAKYFNIISIVFVIIFVGWITQLDYNNLVFSNNISPYLGIISAILFIFSMQFAKRHQNKNN